MRDGEVFRPGGYDVLAQHVMACACAAPFNEAELLDEVRSAMPYSGLDAATFGRVIEFVATGGYALKAYDKFRKLVPDGKGNWRLSHPKFAAQHRFNTGIIVDAPMLDVRFKMAAVSGEWRNILQRPCALATASSSREWRLRWRRSAILT